MNKHRIEEGNEVFVSNKILEKASDIQAYYMAQVEDETLKNKGKLKTTAKRVILYGGTNKVEEVVESTNIRKGKTPYTYEHVAQELVNNWMKKRKTEAVWRR